MYLIRTLISARKSVPPLLTSIGFRSLVVRSSSNISSAGHRDRILDEETKKLLEKLSLVNFENEEYIAIVEDAIRFADRIHSTCTDNVEPLITILEDRTLRLRDDVMSEGNCQKEILRNAKVVEEDYFVAPPVSENCFYIYPVLSDSTVLRYNYGPMGELLRNNIFNEWLFSNVVCRDGNVFPFYSDQCTKTDALEGIEHQYAEAKKMCDGRLPFSIVHAKIPTQQTISAETEESKYFKPQQISQLRSITFTAPDDGRRYFHYWLRQRKMWWRKFSSNPNRYTVTEINTENENLESAKIQINFPWNVQEIETVNSFSAKIFDSMDASQQMFWKLNNTGRKSVFPCMIESITNLEMATMCFLCDSYSEDVRLDTDLPHEALKLHRKLAPYKVAVVSDQKAQKNLDLFRLGEFLTLSLRKIGIATLYLTHDNVKSLEDKLGFYDLLGVPYVAVLQESTLKDGLFGLRCRETTLQETLHISNLTSHVEKLLKNY